MPLWGFHCDVGALLRVVPACCRRAPWLEQPWQGLLSSNQVTAPTIVESLPCASQVKNCQQKMPHTYKPSKTRKANKSIWKSSHYCGYRECFAVMWRTWADPA